MRKSVLRTFILTASLTMMLTVSANAESATVTGNGVNVRSGPGVSYAVLDSLPRDTIVTVTDRSNSAWFAVSFDGREGYISSSYLRILEGEPEIRATVSSSAPAEAVVEASVQAPVQAAAGNAYINAMYVRFRSGPSSGYSVLGEYNTGKMITLNSVNGSWAYVTIDGVNGYIYAPYITMGTYAAAPAPQSQEAAAPVAGEGGSVMVNAVSNPPAVSGQPVAAQPPATQLTVIGQSGEITGSNVRFRSGPSSRYSILADLNKGREVTITGEENGWTAVIIDGQSGFVYSQYVKATGTTIYAEAPAAETATPSQQAQATAPQQATAVGKAGYITGNGVRMRTGPGSGNAVITELFYGNGVLITGQQNGWTAVSYNGKNGYVYSQYVTEGSNEVIDASISAVVSNTSPAPAAGNAAANDIVSFGLSLVGSKYAWGGASPETGFDCSGFVSYVYGQYGYKLNRVAADQALNGTHVDPSNMQPGDILCFYSGSSYIGHVGIYIGNNKFVHACNANTGVIVTELTGYYASRGYEVRRIIG